MYGYNKLRAPELTTWSIPQWLISVGATPDRVALRYKDQGIYHEITWRQYRRLVAEFLAGLEHAGCVAAAASQPWPTPAGSSWSRTWRRFAAAPSATALHDLSVSEVEYQLDNGDAEFFCAENQEFVDKLLNIPGRMPRIRKIVVFDTRALFQYTDDRLISFQDVLTLGRGRLATMSNRETFLDDRSAAVGANDIAVLVYTSGTTGPPKAR